MYQGARHIMLGSPAFVLLVALGIQALFAGSRGAEEKSAVGSRQSAVGSPHSSLSTLAAIIALAILISGAAVALNNLYNNPAYSKDDFRRLIRYIEQRAGDQDVIVYNNAVLLPLHEHYRARPDIAVTALPEYPQHATGQEPELAALTAAYDRVWFITDPPADKRDERKLIQHWFEDNLSVVDGRLFPARTTEARTIAYDTGALQVAELPAGTQPLEIRWEGLPSLRGVRLASPQPVALPTLWLDLYWEGAMTPEMVATLLRFTVRGPDGREWEIRDRTLLPRWENGRQNAGLNRVSYSVPLPVGLPPGEYTIILQPKNEQAEVQSLLTTAVAPTSEWPATVAELYSEEAFGELAGHSPVIRFENGLALQSAVISDLEVRPGHNLPLTLFWQAEQPVETGDLRYRLEVVGPDGELLRWQADPPGASWLQDWSPGMVVQQTTGLYFYPETEPGLYKLRWSLGNGEETIAGQRPWQPWSGATIDYGQVEVRPWPLERSLPEGVTLVEADFGTLAQLYGYTAKVADSSIDLSLTWQVAEPTEISYLIFVHVINEASGELVAQTDRFPVDNLRPTTGWRAGEVLSDNYRLSLPPDLPAGRYAIYVGLYNPDDGHRLPVSLEGAVQPDGRLRLATLELP
jgi:hypothetical protein